MKIDKKLLAELQNATIIAGGAAAFARECGVDPANISRYLNGKVHTISDDNWEKLAPRLNSLSPTPTPRDVIRNTAVLRECVKDAMLRLNVCDATTLCRRGTTPLKLWNDSSPANWTGSPMSSPPF